ncbi:MAG TPA: 2OG-Fe(II) oxygenase family protein [Burkholderiaceae bacterium]|jgi:uncharacterized protein (TIGR02466 family)
MQVLELFPIPVFITKSTEIDTQALSRTIYGIQQDELAAGVADKTGFSNIGGFRSYDILERPGFEALRKFIVTTLNEKVLQGKWYLEPRIDENFISGMWTMINKKGHANSMHIHPDSWFSGVYYPKVPSRPELAGELCFHDPITTRTFTRSFYRSVQAEVFRLTPEEGMMVIFPSWFEHSVRANQSEEDRISIAFNIRKQQA